MADKPALTPKQARVALWLGRASFASFWLSIVLGGFIKAIGINSLFMTLVLPLSLAAILISRSYLVQHPDLNTPGRKEASMGFRLGLVSLFLTLLVILSTALFFLSWLFKAPS